jgi:hypothetical protein
MLHGLYRGAKPKKKSPKKHLCYYMYTGPFRIRIHLMRIQIKV